MRTEERKTTTAKKSKKRRWWLLLSIEPKKLSTSEIVFHTTNRRSPLPSLFIDLFGSALYWTWGSYRTNYLLELPPIYVPSVKTSYLFYFHLGYASIAVCILFNTISWNNVQTDSSCYCICVFVIFDIHVLPPASYFVSLYLHTLPQRWDPRRWEALEVIRLR